jgi:hypothetical protein
MRRVQRSKRLGVAVLAVAMVGLLGGTSPAATLMTLHLGPATVMPDQAFAVSVSNVGGETVTVNVRILDQDGDVVAGPLAVSVPPGTTAFKPADVTISTQGQFRALVVAPSAAVDDLRLSFHVLDPLDATAFFGPNQNPIVFASSVFGPAVRVVPEHGLRVLVTNLGRSKVPFIVDYIDEDGVVVQSTAVPVGPRQTEAVARMPSANTELLRVEVSAPSGARALLAQELVVDASGLVHWYGDIHQP